MKRILMVKELGIDDLGVKEEVDRAINVINIEESPVVELDLRHCFIDYPLTSRVLDRILFDIEKLNGSKELIIRHDYYLPEQTLLNLLFIGSEFFEIQSDQELPLEKLKKTISDNLSGKNMLIEIIIVDRSGSDIGNFSYGK